MRSLEDVVPRIVTVIRRGEAPDLADAIAYEAGDAWVECGDGEAMLAVLGAVEPANVLHALRACAAARRAVPEATDEPGIDLEAQRATIRRVWAEAVRRVCPTPPPLLRLVNSLER